MSRARTFPGAYHSPTTPTSATSSVFSDPDDDSAYVDATDEDGIARELAVLEELRRNVQKNLKLRPISPNNLSGQPRNNNSNSNSNNNINNNHNNNHSNHSNRNSSQFHHPPQTPFSAVSNVSSNLPFYTPTENWPAFRLHSRTDSQDSRRLSASSFSSYYFYDDSDDDEEDVDDQSVDYDPSKPRPFQPNTLLRALLRHPSDSSRRLLIDTRPAGSYLASRLPFSLNIAIPSLILKRCLKPGGGFATLSSLRAFISTERGKASWDSLLNTPGAWDGTAIIYDEDMDESDPLAPAPPPSVSASGSSSMAWTLLSVLKPLIPGTVYFLRGGISAIRRLPRGLDLIVSGEREVEVEGAPLESPADLEHHVNLRDSLQVLPDANGGLTLAPTPTKRGTAQKGLFQLRTDVAARHRPMPELEPPTTSPGPPLSPRRSVTIDIPPSPHHGMTPDTSTNTDSSETPSPPRSAIPPPTANRPTLARLDIKGPKGTTERLKAAAPPKLQLQLQLKTPAPARSATLPAPPTAAGKGPKLKLRLDTPAVHPSTFNAASVTIMNIPSSPEESSGSSNDNLMSPPPSSPRSFITAPRSPGTPLPPSPMTARPMDEDASPAPEFVISTILPGFLFLGPEIVLPEQAAQLEERGVKRILNIAIECDDDQGLNLRQRFEKYIRIPMRDTVEEANVAKRMREVCDFLDDARLHSSPTYVHCKAGKSRSVTAIMAYLIHANHWTLSSAYAFVLDRRKGISPNIGFVSELMNFEEEELGGKSIGVVANGTTGPVGGYGYGQRRGGHLRESMPPAVQSTGTGGAHDPLARGQVSAGPLGISESDMMMLRDVGEAMEIRDASGRYRHARRAPVDEYTLQPTRRVSKAGLESSWGE